MMIGLVVQALKRDKQTNSQLSMIMKKWETIARPTSRHIIKSFLVLILQKASR